MGGLDAGGGPEPQGKKGHGLHKRKGRPGITLDMTPMVDIGFLLVIFFMTTTRMREPQAIEITLPPDTEGSTVNIAESNVLTINIMADGTIQQYIGNIKVATPEPVAVDSLDGLLLTTKTDNIKRQPAHYDKFMTLYESGEEFLKRYDAMPKDVEKSVRDSMNKVRDEKICRLTVLVKVARESSYDHVVAVMDAIQQNQIARFAIVEQTADDLKEIEEVKKKAAAAAKKGGK
ncbi:MAG: biopolymer transporter ExbD [Candidatus Edwardsbacteria bacterium]|jgi:biopolymer transport protein ExbD|nr:biopolymer transporter ExbD [Candidatus Edwardsbacteria bacterium]